MRLALALWVVIAGLACRQLLSIDELEGFADIDAPGVDGNDVDADPAAPDATDIDAAPAPDAAVDAFVLVCPSGYVDVTGQTSKYRVVGGLQTWVAAEADCENDGAGGVHLVVIDDAPENQAIDALSSATSIWIGTSDRVTEGTFRSVTGPPSAYFDWEPGDPDSGANGDCVAMIAGNWQDGSCSSSATAVCECDGIAPDPTSY